MRWLALFCILAACDGSRGQAPAAGSTAPSPTESASAATESPWREAHGIRYLELYTGGAEPTDELPLVVAVHGLGDQPERFAALLSDMPVRARLVVPQGLSAHHGGFAWFDLGGDDAARASGLSSAATRLARLIDTVALRGSTRGRPVITGFSQGGMLSFAIAVHHGSSISAAIPIAGALPRPLWPKSAPERAPPITALHGDADRLLAIEPTRALVRHLRAAGFTVELREYPGVGHSVSEAMKRELQRQIAAATAR